MRGYSCVGLDNPKSSINVGHVLRAAGCYQADMVAIGGKRPDHYMNNNICTDTHKQWRHIPVLRTENLKEVIPYGCIPVSVDLIDGARPLNTYTHPERAFYIFGAEDATLGERITSWCRDIIYIPTNYCMNLSACVNVVLYDRMVKKMASQNNVFTQQRRCQ